MFTKLTFVWFTVVMTILFTSSNPLYAGEKEIISSFEKIVNENKKIVEVFPETIVNRGEESELVAEARGRPELSGKTLYRKEKITLTQISYDVKKTDSLVSPYEGVIVVEVLRMIGDEVISPSEARNYVLSKKQLFDDRKLKDYDSEEVRKIISNLNNEISAKIQVGYVYQKSQWIKKYLRLGSEIITTDQVLNEYFKDGNPYLSLFPQVYIDLK